MKNKKEKEKAVDPSKKTEQCTFGREEKRRERKGRKQQQMKRGGPAAPRQDMGKQSDKKCPAKHWITCAKTV